MAEDFLRLFVMNAAFYSQLALTNSLVPTGNKGRSSQYFASKRRQKLVTTYSVTAGQRFRRELEEEAIFCRGQELIEEVSRTEEWT